MAKILDKVEKLKTFYAKNKKLHGNCGKARRRRHAVFIQLHLVFVEKNGGAFLMGQILRTLHDARMQSLISLMSLITVLIKLNEHTHTYTPRCPHISLLKLS